MKTHSLQWLILVSAIFSFWVWTGKVSATVGGPTYISSIAFDTKDNSVYYTVHNYSEVKECPQIIHKLDLTTLQDSEVGSCKRRGQEFSYQNPSYLGSVSLQKNKIDIRVQPTSAYIRLDEGYPLWHEFLATVTQDKKYIASISFRGCAKDQPHIFEGYMIPDSDAMALLISNKGNCFEGGYVNESLHMIKGVTYYDTNIIRSIKEEDATEPNLGNMIVHAIVNDKENNGRENGASANDTDNVSVPQKSSVTDEVPIADEIKSDDELYSVFCPPRGEVTKPPPRSEHVQQNTRSFDWFFFAFIPIFVIGTTLGYVLGKL